MMGFEKKMSDAQRVDLIIEAANQSPLSFDLLEALSVGMDAKALAILCGNASRLPQYIKSKDNPNLSRTFKAPLMDMRKSPLSH